MGDWGGGVCKCTPQLRAFICAGARVGRDGVFWGSDVACEGFSRRGVRNGGLTAVANDWLTAPGHAAGPLLEREREREGGGGERERV